MAIAAGVWQARVTRNNRSRRRSCPTSAANRCGRRQGGYRTRSIRVLCRGGVRAVLTPRFGDAHRGGCGCVNCQCYWRQGEIAGGVRLTALAATAGGVPGDRGRGVSYSLASMAGLGSDSGCGRRRADARGASDGCCIASRRRDAHARIAWIAWR